MAILKDLIVNGASRFIGDAYFNTIKAGVWNGTVIDVAHGGTGKNSVTSGYLLVGNGNGTMNERLIVNDVGTSTSATTIPTSGAVYSAISAGFAANGAMVFKGTYTAQASSSSYVVTSGFSTLPGSSSLGWTWIVTGNNTYFGNIVVEAGDMIISKTSNPGTTISNYYVIQTNIDVTHYVTTNTAQTITGAKTFNAETTFNELSTFNKGLISTSIGDSDTDVLFVSGNSSFNDIVNIYGLTNHGNHIIPMNNNAYDLGSSSLKWRNIYATTFTGSLSGNASSATTATNLSSKPSFATYASDTTKITLTAGGKTSDAYTVPYATYSNTVKGTYTTDGGLLNPNYFGYNRVGFLMMNTTVNGNSNYKDWMIMDCYNSNDVGGGVAFGVNRLHLGAYIMRSESARTSWTESAELYGTHNLTKSVVTGLIGSLTYANKYTYSLPSNKGVRITYTSYEPVLVSVSGGNGGALLILIGSGYGSGGTIRNKFTELVSSSYFDWSLPQSDSIACSVEVYSRRSSDSNVVVISTNTVTFTAINALTTDKLNATLLTSGNTSFSSLTLAWGSAKTFATVNGTSYSITLPSNPNTDVSVTQERTTTSNWKPVVLGFQQASQGSTELYSTVTDKVYTTNILLYQPSTGTLCATKFTGLAAIIEFYDRGESSADDLTVSNALVNKGTPDSHWWHVTTDFYNSFNYAKFQYAGSYNLDNPELYIRQRYNSTWTEWKKLLREDVANANYVSAVAISGNYLRVTKNGSNSDLTIPYATSASNATNSSKLGYHNMISYRTDFDNFTGENAIKVALFQNKGTDDEELVIPFTDGSLISFPWSTSNNYGAQLAVEDYGQTHHLAIRNRNGVNTWGKWAIILTSTNYNLYSPKLDGTGASGTWGINITGSATSAGKATNDSDGNAINSTYVKKTGDSMSGRLSILTLDIDKSSPVALQLVINGPTYDANMDISSLKVWPGIGFHMPSRTYASLIFDGKFKAVSSNFTDYVNFFGAGFLKSGSSDSYVLLGGGGHKAISDFKIGNYLPLDGGTLTGNLYLKGSANLVTNSTGNYANGIRINRTETSNCAGMTIGYVSSDQNGGGTGYDSHTWMIATPANSDYLNISQNGNISTSTGLTLRGHGTNDIKWNNNTIYHAGNLPAYPTKTSWNYDDRYVSSLTTSGNYLRWVKNGSNNDITIPYATSSQILGITSITSEADITDYGLRVYSGSGSNWTGTISSMAYAAILHIGNPSRGFLIWTRRDNDAKGLCWRRGNSDQTDWSDIRFIADSVNSSLSTSSTNVVSLKLLNSTASVYNTDYIDNLSLYANTTTTSSSIKLYNNTWTLIGNLIVKSLESGTYMVSISTNSSQVASGFFSAIKNTEDYPDGVEEIPLHYCGVESGRFYAGTQKGKFVMSSKATELSARIYTITFKRII